MKKFLLIISLLFSVPVYAQEFNQQQLDSLYYTFIKMRLGTDIQTDIPSTQPELIKCGFGIINQIKFNIERFSFERQQVLKTLMSRPERDTSIVSPSGRFRIHYNISGPEKPNYNPLLSLQQNVDEVAKAIDSAYNFEVNFLGYSPHPADNGEGGDDRYDIYITNAIGNYGFTQPELSLGSQKYTSHMQIHFDFGGFYTEGFDAARVTVAHEYHHAIQIGSYTGDKTEADPYFYELSSTAMEEFVYDNVNDYWDYMDDYFNNPDRSFANNNGYNLAIWNIFLRDKFGYGILKRQWELFTSTRALNAIASSISENGSGFGSKLNEFGVWTFFTNYRYIPDVYFKDAANYPLIKPASTIVFNSQPVNGQAKPTSNNFIIFFNSSDTLVSIISNSDYLSGINNINTDFPYTYTLSSDSIGGSTRLTNDYFAKLDVDQDNFWESAEILNNQVIRLDSTIFPVLPKGEMFAYPNPFYYNKSYNCDCIKILLDSHGEPEADLNVYTSAMELVYSSRIDFDVTGKILVWKDIHNLNLASGVYIYAIRAGDETSKGKLVIFNE